MAGADVDYMTVMRADVSLPQWAKGWYFSVTIYNRIDVNYDDNVINKTQKDRFYLPAFA